MLEFWEQWEAANIRRYWQPYRPYREICRASLDETFHHFGIYAQHDVAALQVLCHFAHLDVDLVADRLHALDHSRSGTVDAGG